MTAKGLTVSPTRRVYDNILQTVGNTPLVRLTRIDRNLPCPIYAKVEFFNPGGSVKDRIGINMIREAEKQNRLSKGGTVVEATSGNTGVGLAIACAILGYKAVFVMPDKMSLEKIQLLRAFGARVVITPTAVEPDDPRSYYKVADRIVAETPNAILANQYHNPENPRSHYETTGPEIWHQTEGRVTDVVIGMGTGGTISGMGKYLKEQNPNIRMVGVDPTGSILLETWQAGDIPKNARAAAYKVEGIGEDFLPTTLDLSMIDEVIRVSDRESFLWTRRLVREEGIFCGGSSGSALAAAVQHAQTRRPGDLIVVVLPDSGSRYLSKIFDDKWMRENGFLETTWSEVTLGALIEMKASPELITAQTNERMIDVIALMKKHDISQVPAVGSDGSLAGIVTEVDLLNHMLQDDHTHQADESIRPIVQEAAAVFPPDTTLGEILPVLTEGQIVLVIDDQAPIGIVTKIDILDFISQEI
jgi:cystathionine beta-synthase